jgi:hypothetical protein
MADDAISEMTLHWNEPLAVEVTDAVSRGQVDRVQRLIEKHPGLPQAWIIKEGSRRPDGAPSSISLPIGPATAASIPP